jgi:hypothetical protein
LYSAAGPFKVISPESLTFMAYVSKRSPLFMGFFTMETFMILIDASNEAAHETHVITDNFVTVWRIG